MLQDFVLDTRFTWQGLLILCILLLCIVLLLRFYIIYPKKLKKHIANFKKSEANASAVGSDNTSAKENGISVVISGKNQYQNLYHNLPFWFMQKCDNYEVIVVYDFLDDELDGLLKQFQIKNTKLVRLPLDQDANYFNIELNIQKFVLSIGIKTAKYSHVLLTTAACRPENEFCLRDIIAQINSDTNLISGCVIYDKERVSSTARYFLYESDILSQSFSLNGLAYTAQRKNLVYKKDEFLANNGYTEFYALPSGTYDYVGNYKEGFLSVKPSIKPSTFLKSNEYLDFSSYLSAEKQFRNVFLLKGKKLSAELSLYRAASNVFQLMFCLGLAYAYYFVFLQANILASLWTYIFVALFLIKTIWQYAVYVPIYTHFGEKKLAFALPFFELLRMLSRPLYLFARENK